MKTTRISSHILLLCVAAISQVPTPVRADPPVLSDLVLSPRLRLPPWAHLLLEPQAIPRCSDFGGTKTGCVYDPLRIADPIAPSYAWEGVVEADYNVTYSFPCSGQATGLNFVAGGVTYPIEMGADRSTRIITSTEALEVRDLDAHQTAVHWLTGSCEVTIHRVTSSPSLGTLNVWKSEAMNMAERINLRLDFYAAIKGLIGITEFDAAGLDALQRRLLVDITRQMPDGLTRADVVYPDDHPDESLRKKLKSPADMPAQWRTAFAMNPLLRSNVLTLAQVESILAGRPAYTTVDLEALYAQLMSDGQRAAEMIQRGERYRGIFDAQMRSLHDSLATTASQIQVN